MLTCDCSAAPGEPHDDDCTHLTLPPADDYQRALHEDGAPQ